MSDQQRQGRYLDQVTTLLELDASTGETGCAIYRNVLQKFETFLWQDSKRLLRYVAVLQGLYREYEQDCLHQSGARHDFVIVIPVADRPRQLSACLESLRRQQQLFAYRAGEDNSKMPVRVLLADDSADPLIRDELACLAERFSRQELPVEYFGPEQQAMLLEAIEPPRRRALEPLLGRPDELPNGHKGASITRNICYLRLQQMACQQPRTLFLFMDSDQEFAVRVQVDGKGQDLQALNYFYWLDRLFAEHSLQVLTGKVVGDPPVSPAVMAGTLLEDLLQNLQRFAAGRASDACDFHAETAGSASDAAYHDMPDLFGFSQASAAFHYACPMTGRHTLAESLAQFAGRLPSFFYGEHPTRVTYFEGADIQQSLQPARTIYTGNYVLSASALEFFIPFADQRLRMAGPVLGRLIQARIGKAFVSANLPLLHCRTEQQSGQSEYRSGVSARADKVDLSGEFIRQFFGDVMLFSVIELTGLGYPQADISADQINQLVRQTADRLMSRYLERQQQTLAGIDSLRKLVDSPGQWWLAEPALEQDIVEPIRQLIENLEWNFGESSPAYDNIKNPGVFDSQLQAISEGLRRYTDLRKDWLEVLSALTASSG